MSNPTVKTLAGAVSGVAFEGYERYLGIPYARPPVGTRRFAAPEPAQPWLGTLAAEEFGPHAPQLPSVMEQFFSGGSQVVFDEAECLRLNVWTPRADGSGRPVLVWIHGGAFIMGSSAAPWYDGARFVVDHDVVVVSFNYRLGVLGFTYLGDVGDPEYRGSGSLGIQDAVAALRWVKENIAGFGGDPANVTVFGESAGAMSVGTLLGLAQAPELFHKAILQSGAASHVFSAPDAAELTGQLLSILGVSGGDVVEKLQSAPVEDLLAAYQTLVSRHPRNRLLSRPVVDGEILDRPPLDAISAGAAAGIPVLIGTNLDEWRLFSVLDPDRGSVDERYLADAVGGLVPTDPLVMIETYRRRRPEASAAEVLDAVMTDSTFRIPAIQLAESQIAAGGHAWMYLFTWVSPQFGGAFGSCHALEIPFVFNTLDQHGAAFFVGDDPPVDLSRRMNATWVAFARHGDPGPGALGEWPGCGPEARPTMVIDVEARVESDPFGEERSLWPGH